MQLLNYDVDLFEPSISLQKLTIPTGKANCNTNYDNIIRNLILLITRYRYVRRPKLEMEIEPTALDPLANSLKLFEELLLEAKRVQFLILVYTSS